ncbi:MAG: response regulator [Acidobacteria bacterium]|nr:response regulator [Acidobacteriota bacterium]
MVPLSRWERGEIEWMVVFVPRTAVVSEPPGLDGSTTAAVAATQRLAQTVAHEANNLVMITSGYGREILTQLPETSTLREDVTTLLDATKRIAAMTSLLTDYGRQRKSEIVHCQLDDLAPGETVAADRAALDEAMAAAKALAGGAMQVRSSRQAPFLLLTMSGFPMTAEALRQLLEPLSKQARQGDETARAAARIGPLLAQAGARWTVTDAPAIAVYLPLAGAANAAAPEPAPAAKTALVVDDQLGIRRIVRRVLEGMGFTVEEAGSGEEAASWLERRGAAPQLLVTDMRMPGMSGRDVAGRVRFRFPDTPILFISGYTDDPGVQSGILPERSRFLSKPFDPDQLRAAVKELIG